MSVALRDVSISYGEVQVVNAVSLDVKEGSWLAPIGPNGAGKSTLLRALCGLVAFSGSISLFDVTLPIGSRRALARQVAYVPQRPEMPPTMTVAEYVLLGRTPHISFLGSEKHHDREVVGEVLDRLDLTTFSRRMLSAISGGEAQRVVLARAIAQQAPLLLLDEPTSSLDLGHQQQVLEVIDSLRKERGLTVISAMHDLTLAGQFADELALIVDGKILALGPPRDVLTEKALSAHYGATVEVLDDHDGGILVVPKRTGRDAQRQDR